MTLLRAAAALACLLASALPLRAQIPSPAQEGAVRVFLQCSGFYCEPDYYQTEIAFVTHVRDRSDADVHVLISPEATAAGGTAYTLAFLGQGRFAGDTLTLRHTSEPGASEDARRQGLAQVIKLGLVRYVAQTPQGARLTVSYAAPRQTAAATPERDPWNHWSFQLRGHGFFNGEQTYRSRSMLGTVSASRTTERWKLRLSVNASEDHTRFEVDSATVLTSTQTSRSVNGLLVRSLGAHLSAGVTASASRSSFFNQDMALRIAPAVEYNLYPYAESTRRQLTFRYSVGPVAYDYDQETIFERTSETRVQQALVGSLVARQPWGSVNVSAEAASFLRNFEQNRLQIGGGVELNLVRGLSLNVDGWYERLRDQLYLPAGEATEEEILLRRRQLATGFQYFAAMGLSYTFGSRFRTVVNSRFPNAVN
ncbi:MAG TPA: hypothetical protein VHG08_25440 [Longimicrobium sp.]|nr:hypothetical protein [Longimicrobium sp.]